MDSKFTVMASDALKLAKRTARSLKLNYVGTEHILMGLILEDGCVASRILLDNGIDDIKVAATPAKEKPQTPVIKKEEK